MLCKIFAGFLELPAEFFKIAISRVELSLVALNLFRVFAVLLLSMFELIV